MRYLSWLPVLLSVFASAESTKMSLNVMRKNQRQIHKEAQSEKKVAERRFLLEFIEMYRTLV